MEDTARQAGLATTVLPMEQIVRTPKGAFVDLAGKPIGLNGQALSVGMDVPRAFRRLARIAERTTRWLEPAVESDPVPTRAPPLFVGDVPLPSKPAAGVVRRRLRKPRTGRPFVRKPFNSRERLKRDDHGSGQAVDQDHGPLWRRRLSCARRSRPCRAMRELRSHRVWIAAGNPCGLSCAGYSPITKNTSRFLPHAIVG